MTEAKDLARALNLRHSDSIDLIGGADAEALEELISEFMAPGSEDQTPDCKYSINQNNYSYVITFFFKVMKNLMDTLWVSQKKVIL